MQNVGLAMGLAPDEITMDNLAEVEERLLAMKRNVGVVGDIATIQTALATGDADIVLGGGQWIVTGLQEENPALDWTVPEEGGIFYLESVGIVASSEKKELANEYVKYLISAAGQGRFAMNSCGMAMPANSKAEHDRRGKGTAALGPQGHLPRGFPTSTTIMTRNSTWR